MVSHPETFTRSLDAEPSTYSKTALSFTGVAKPNQSSGAALPRSHRPLFTINIYKKKLNTTLRNDYKQYG